MFRNWSFLLSGERGPWVSIRISGEDEIKRLMENVLEHAAENRVEPKGENGTGGW